MFANESEDRQWEYLKKELEEVNPDFVNEVGIKIGGWLEMFAASFYQNTEELWYILNKFGIKDVIYDSYYPK
jgi:cephalosporin hydroxylase